MKYERNSKSLLERLTEHGVEDREERCDQLSDVETVESDLSPSIPEG